MSSLIAEWNKNLRSFHKLYKQLEIIISLTDEFHRCMKFIVGNLMFT